MQNSLKSLDITKPSLHVQNLIKSFAGKMVVKGVSLSLQPNEVLGFLGPNGAGKTTTMRMITGYLRSDNFCKGQIEIAGFDPFDHPETAKANLGYLPEGAPAWGEMQVAEFLEFIASAHGLDHSSRKIAKDRVCSLLNLESCWYQSIQTLSKGFRRRVGFAAALIHDPAILILDEPTDGLDPNQKHEVRNLIKELARHKAILVSTHILEEINAFCDRVVILSAGLIVADGSSEMIAQHDPEYIKNNQAPASLERAFRALTLNKGGAENA